MAVLRFSRSDVEHLAEKLDRFRSELSHHEQVLLLVVFSAAADRVSQLWPESTADTLSETDLTELQDQLVDSFLPGLGDEFIMMDIKHWPPPPSPPSSPSSAH